MTRFLRYALFPFSAFLLITSFTLLLGPISFIVMPFKWQTRRNFTGPFWRAFGYFSIYFVTFSRLYKDDRREKDLHGKGSPPGLYIANHQSFLDIPVILTSIQIPPIMKKEVLYIPLLGVCGYSSGAIIVDRKDSNSRKKVFQEARNRLIKYDKSLQYYPEGTRQRKDCGPKDFSEIKKPLMLFAYQNNIKIYPVSIFGTRKVLNEKSGLVNYGRKVGSIFHAPIDPAHFEDPDQFMQVAWKKVQEGYDELAEKLN